MHEVAIILAAGTQERWDGEGKKQLMLTFNDEPVIRRTARQCINRDWDTYVITHDQEIAKYAECKWIKLDRPTDYLCDTLTRTRAYWGDRNHILLGDVCYSPFVLNNLDDFWTHRFTGRRNELFAFSFDTIAHLFVIGCLDLVRRRFYAAQNQHGKLWQLFYVMHGMEIDPPHQTHYLPKEPHPFFWMIPDDDYTFDFDTPSRYNKWYRENVK